MPFKPEEKRWLVEQGVWKACWKRRDALKAEGMKPAKACRQALAEFYHQDDQPPAASAQAGAELQDEPVETETVPA